MPIKCLRVQIIKPYNEPNSQNPVTWDELGRVLRDLRYESSKIANFVIQKCYEWEIFKREYKEFNGKYPSPKEHLDKSYLYPLVRGRFPHIGASLVNQVRQEAEKRWKIDRLDVLSLRKSIPSFKLNFPICVYNKSYSVKKVDDNYIITLGLMPKGSDRTQYQVIVKAGENSKRVILDRIVSGEYKQSSIKIISDRKKKWYCLIPYDFVQRETKLDQDKIIGVDLGIANVAYWAFNDSLKRGYIEGHEIEAFRKRVQERRKAIQRQGKYCGQGRIGHGRKRRLQPVDVLAERESNFRDTANHRYARKIVAEAVNHGCGTIQMEDLSGIENLSKFLKTWPYGDLQQKIIDKAAEYGIKVVKINPEYTSQRCSECGHIEKENRPDQKTFICKQCGFEAHADYNAARNISIQGIDGVIKETLKNK